MTSLNALFDQCLATEPDRCWLYFNDKRYRYAQTEEAVSAFAEVLRALNIGKGDRVGIYLTKSPAAVIAMLACSRLQAIYIPVNPLLKVRQLGHVVDDCQPDVLIMGRERLAGIEQSLGETSVQQVIALASTLDVTDYQVIPVNGGGRRMGTPARFEQAELILYTSGSTGKPKGVVVSQDNLKLGGESVAAYLNLTQEDRILALLPFAFDYGLNQLVSALAAGCRVTLLDFLFPKDVVTVVKQQGITGIAGVPALWFRLAGANWGEGTGGSVRYFTNSGGAMPGSLLDKLQQAFPNADPYLMYGFTEAFRSTYLPPDRVRQKPGSIGKAIPNAEVFVINEQGQPAAPREHGQLVHCGPLVTLGYWNTTPENAKRYAPAPECSTLHSADGSAAWSGDTAYADEQGYLYFIGRSDEMIKCSGYRISPDEVEEIAYTLEGVAEAVALGVTDPVLGQKIVLIVTLEAQSALDEDGIKLHYRKTVPEYMVPAMVFVWPGLPRTPSGKFDRVLVKERVQGQITAGE